MSDNTTFRTATPSIETSQPNLPDPEPNIHGGTENIADLEPVEDQELTTLYALGIDDSLKNLPPEDRANLKETAGYVADLVKAKGLPETAGSYQKVLDQVKGEMGLDEDADPQAVLDRIGGVVKAWKGLTFISDPKEKRGLFMRLARMQSSEEMNRAVLQEMDKRKVWL